MRTGKILAFSVLWPLVGFVLGTSILLGPVRWTTGYVRQAGWPGAAENAVVFAIIAALVMLSIAVAWRLAKVVDRSSSAVVRLGVPAATATLAVAAVWFWMNPALLGSSMGDETEAGPGFTFGPYPDEERLRRLKDEGYAAVVSLLHPAVVPFEPKLLADEKAAAARVGIKLIHLPMLPWVSANADALGRIRQLAEGRRGRYYVHCYLGRDRVQLVRLVVARAGTSTNLPSGPRGAELREFTRYERGAAYELDDMLFLIPYPTDEELVVVMRNTTQVVSLLDPADPGDQAWIENEKAVLGGIVPLEPLPVSVRAYDPDRVLEIARRVRRLPRPLVVHAFLSPSTGRAPAAEAFARAYLTGLPPIRPTLEGEGPGEDRVRLVAPHVAIGPPLTEGGLAGGLYARGVRAAILLGDEKPVSLQAQRALASAAGLRWERVATLNAEFVDGLASGGPWYLYGPLSEAAARVVTSRYGPASRPLTPLGPSS